MANSREAKFAFKNPLSSVFTGRFLVSKGWEKNWPFILYLSLLALIMIASSHSADQKVHEIARLRSEMKELNSEFIDTRSRLMLESMESKVVERATELGLERSEHPPLKINAGNEE
ncbi:MAG: FtsL-like putative cell division protein [Owenweeksia sp.]